MLSDITKALKSWRRRQHDLPSGLETVRPEARRGAEWAEFGLTGLKRSGRLLDEEIDPRLKGRKAALKYQEMVDNSAGLGGAITLMKALLSRVHLTFETAPGAPPEAEAIAEFYQSCLDDMATSWVETRSEIYSVVQYGFALFEPIYKIRYGDSTEPLFHSRFTDGLIGWRDLEPRSQDSVSEWVWDGNHVLGFRQQVDGEVGEPFVPMSKAIHFRMGAPSAHRKAGACFGLPFVRTSFGSPKKNGKPSASSATWMAFLWRRCPPSCSKPALPPK